MTRPISPFSAARCRALACSPLLLLLASGCPGADPDATTGDATGDAPGDAGPTDDDSGDGSDPDDSGGPASDDDTGSDGDPDDGDPDTGSDPSVLADDVFFFVREIADGDALWAYDLATDQAHEVTPLDGGSEITSVAIHPDRTLVAIATDYEALDYQDSESIYAFEVNEDLVFGDPTLLMPGIPKPVGVATGYSQQVDDLRWHPDGSWLWFGHAFQQDFTIPGGGTLAGVDPATGAFELYLDTVGDCSVNTGPSPSPDGSVLLSIRSVCIDGAHDGFVAFDVPPAGEPEMIVPTTEAIFTTPRWLPDGTGIVYAGRIDDDSDGDGAFDVYGNAIVLVDLATGDRYALLPPTPEVYIWDFTLSPAGDRVVVCINQNDAQDLLLLDYSVDPPTSRWLTDDGASCKPSW